MFFGLFKKKSKTDKMEESLSVGDTNIRYKPELIEDLKKDHADLLDIYTDIKMACEVGNFKKVAEYLVVFRNEFEDHLLKENINLYIYLSHLLKDDAMNSSLIANFRKDMDGIATIALKFLAKYESIGTDNNLHEGFAGEFATIGDVLGARIKREETMLYTLYIKPY